MNGGADWPRMRLRYALSQHDTRWPYEMQMIDAWWRKTIAPLAQAGR